MYKVHYDYVQSIFISAETLEEAERIKEEIQTEGRYFDKTNYNYGESDWDSTQNVEIREVKLTNS